MVVKIPLHPHVVSYVHKECGDKPIEYDHRNLIAVQLFLALGKKNYRDEKPSSKHSYVEILVAKKQIKEHRIFPQKQSIEAINFIFMEMIKEDMVRDIIVLENSGQNLKNAILFARKKYGLTEDDLSYSTLNKRVRRKINSYKVLENE